MEAAVEMKPYVSRLRYLDGSGDTEIKWTRGNAEETAAAKAMFDTLKAKKYAAYRMDSSGKRGEQLSGWDPNAEYILMAPQMAGG